MHKEFPENVIGIVVMHLSFFYENAYVVPNRATFEYSYFLALFYSLVREKTCVATNTAIAAKIMTR